MTQRRKQANFDSDPQPNAGKEAEPWHRPSTSVESTLEVRKLLQKMDVESVPRMWDLLHVCTAKELLDAQLEHNLLVVDVEHIVICDEIHKEYAAKTLDIYKQTIWMMTLLVIVVAFGLIFGNAHRVSTGRLLHTTATLLQGVAVQ